uniref:hypothetical protein n=1 Tax=Russula emetica TaxID=152958 RepID=UPI0031F3CDA6
MKYQNYLNYKIPITMNPLEYGKLIEQTDNKYIVQLNTSNIVIINELDNENLVKFFRKGEFIFEFKDFKKSEFSFIRTIEDQRYTFEKNKLISTEILSTASSIKIYDDTDAIILKNSTPLYKDIVNYDKTYLENTYIFKNYPQAWFICLKFSLIFLLYIILFVIFPETNENMAMAVLSGNNIIKLRKTSSKYNWKDLVFNINNKVFSKNLFENLFSQFWIKVENEFTENNHMFILMKIKYNNGEFSSIGKVQRINKSDFSWYIDFIIENMKFKSEYYNETQMDTIIFSYGFKEGKIKNKQNLGFNRSLQKFKNFNLPISMNPMDFGRLINQYKIENGIVYILQNENEQTITFNKFENHNEVEFFKSGIRLVKFKDIFINSSENKFMRVIDNKSFYFKNGEQILFLSEMKTKFISKTKVSKNLTLIK